MLFDLMDEERIERMRAKGLAVPARLEGQLTRISDIEYERMEEANEKPKKRKAKVRA